MPTLAIVDGVKIQFYLDEHPPPHFHAVLAEYVAQIQIRPLRVLRGSLPPAKAAAVFEWARQRESQLLAAWASIAAGRQPEKIG